MENNDVLVAKFTFLTNALAELPPELKSLKFSQLTYEQVNGILNEIVPKVYAVDLRILWAAFDIQGAQRGTVAAQQMWRGEVGKDLSIGDSRTAAMYFAFCIANVQFTAIGGKSIQEIRVLPLEQLGWAIKGATQNAGLMFGKITGGNLGGTKPAGCLILLPFFLFAGLAGGYSVHQFAAAMIT